MSDFLRKIVVIFPILHLTTTAYADQSVDANVVEQQFTSFYSLAAHPSQYFGKRIYIAGRLRIDVSTASLFLNSYSADNWIFADSVGFNLRTQDELDFWTQYDGKDILIGGDFDRRAEYSTALPIIGILKNVEFGRLMGGK